VDNQALQHLPQMAELHRLTHWHVVAPVAMDFLAGHPAVNIFPVVAAAALAVRVPERQVALESTQTSLAQHLCMEVVALDQVDLQAPHLQAVVLMEMRRQLIEVVVVHSLQAVVVSHLQVALVS
jgi:hypothetical protein